MKYLVILMSLVAFMTSCVFATFLFYKKIFAYTDV